MARRKRSRGAKRRGGRRQQRGVIGNALGYIPGIGGVLKPVVGGVEDFVVALNRPKPGKSGPIASRGRMAAANVGQNQSFFQTWSTGSDMHVMGRDLVRPVP